MRNYILIIMVVFFVGCSSVGTYQTWEEGKWTNKERYICRGAGCEVDFKNETMKGGSFIPDIPLKVNN